MPRCRSELRRPHDLMKSSSLKLLSKDFTLSCSLGKAEAYLS
jgi:hypothetical protein